MIKPRYPSKFIRSINNPHLECPENIYTTKASTWGLCGGNKLAGDTAYYETIETNLKNMFLILFHNNLDAYIRTEKHRRNTQNKNLNKNI